MEKIKNFIKLFSKISPAVVGGIFVGVAFSIGGLVLAATPITFPANGGTGWGTPGGLKAHTVLIGNDLSPVATATPSTAGSVLTSNGVNADPTFQTIPANLIYTTIGSTVYYTASSSATDNKSWLFRNGFIATASSTTVGNATTTGNMYVGSLNVNGDWLSDITGTGLSIVGNALTNSGVISLGNGTGITCSGTNPGSCSLVTPVSIANGGTNATSFSIPNTLVYYDGTRFVSTSTNPLYVDAIVATSTDTSKYSSFVNASTTKLSINNVAQYAFKTPGFTIATTTTWTASTTAFQLPAPYTAQTINSVQCYTDAGTLFVDIYHTSTHLTLVSVTSSVATTNFSTNNTMTAGEKWYVVAGTPATSPTQLTCTFNLSPTGI